MDYRDIYGALIRFNDLTSALKHLAAVSPFLNLHGAASPRYRTDRVSFHSFLTLLAFIFYGLSLFLKFRK